ncbi:MAG: hypothetical protein QOH81_2224 [Sphingomonadales bacterium]|jgi:hypothetical protein|nr:hypothetical protein [Sphingomonadales bacterium]
MPHVPPLRVDVAILLLLLIAAALLAAGLRMRRRRRRSPHGIRVNLVAGDNDSSPTG